MSSLGEATVLISLHLPKTAGTSFVASLRDHYGPDAVMVDYLDVPINTPPLKRIGRGLRDAWHNWGRKMPGTECIHGHFLPIKYRLLGNPRDLTFITWMRDPVERIVSHYRGWQRNQNPADIARLHRRVLDEGWSLERFCLSKELRNFYTQFLWCFSPRWFDFIGVTEFYEEDVAYFSARFLGTAVGTHRLNLGEREGPRYTIEPDLRAAIEKHHARDVALYRWAVAQRAMRPPLHDAAPVRREAA